jgi:lambda family phage portal protein
MKILESIFGSKKTKRTAPRRSRRGFAAAKTDRLYQGWPTVNRSADAELYAALKILRARSRDLAINDDYVARFLAMVKANVVGPKGIGFQNRAREDNGALDTVANQKIEDGWRAWGRAGVCSVDGRLSWIDACALFAETTARDGECFVKEIRNPKVNRFGYALQFIDADYLDEAFNEIQKDGRIVRLSIEYDALDRPIAYHLLAKHPNAILTSIDPNRRLRVPADEIIHGFLPRRVEQGRGYPWTAQSLRRLKMLAGYEHAELIAARVGASKMGFFLEPAADEYTGDYEEDFDPVTEADPGTFDRLPAGTDFKAWTPDHPVAAFEAFILAILRGAASGLGVSYVGLTNDLRGVSYSSIRQGALDERDHWRMLQTWIIEHFVDRVFTSWLKMALTTQAVALPLGKFDKFNAPIWRPRGWTWIDPLKEVKANTEAIQNNLKSLAAALAEQGVDIEDVLIDNAIAKELADKHGQDLPILGGTNAGA